MVGASAGAGGARLLQSLTAFTNLVLAGDIPVETRPFFFGASLTAINKKDGGVRPIGVGCTLRRLEAKVASRSVMERMGQYLAPLQLGHGTPSVRRQQSTLLDHTSIYYRLIMFS